MKTIITSGGKISEGVFTDIDTLACAIAYNELLSFLKIESRVVLVGPLNNTITESVKKWKYYYTTDYEKEPGDSYVVVDCSNPSVFPEFIKIGTDNLEVWDHRFGYQDFWRDVKAKTIIEDVGACATLIWEEFIKNKFDTKISSISANLLYTAIFSNTLNFNASVTTDRDIKAFEELKKYVDIPVNWIEKYYSESEAQTILDPISAIKNDTKIINFPDKDIKVTIGQIELWNSFNFITNNMETIKNTLQGFGCDEWFMTAPSISEGKNYIYTESQKVKELLAQKIDANFDGDFGVTEKLWLRKEILKKLLA